MPHLRARQHENDRIDVELRPAMAHHGLREAESDGPNCERVEETWHLVFNPARARNLVYEGHPSRVMLTLRDEMCGSARQHVCSIARFT